MKIQNCISLLLCSVSFFFTTHLNAKQPQLEKINPLVRTVDLNVGEHAAVELVDGSSVTVEFLGAKVSFPVGVYAFAALARAPHAYMFGIRTGTRRYRFIAEPAGECTYRNRRQKNADHQIWAQAFATRLEHYVRQDPFQWGNFFSIWEAQPPDPVS